MSDKPNFEPIWNTYKQHINSRARLTVGAKKKIATRLENYTDDELCKAIEKLCCRQMVDG